MLREGIGNLVQLGTIEHSEASHARITLEVPAVRLAATKRSEAELDKMDRILSALEVASVDDPEIPSLDLELHTTISLAAGNRVLACLIFALHTASEPVRQLALTREVGRSSHKQHRRIVEAIRERDPDEAERAMRDHLSYLSAVTGQGEPTED